MESACWHRYSRLLLLNGLIKLSQHNLPRILKISQAGIPFLSKPEPLMQKRERSCFRFILFKPNLHNGMLVPAMREMRGGIPREGYPMGWLKAQDRTTL